MINENDFTRDNLVELICNKYKMSELLFEKFESKDLSETENFIFYHEHNGDVSIIDKFSLDGEIRVINWHKMTHIGRAMNIRGFDDVIEIDQFLCQVKKELLEERNK